MLRADFADQAASRLADIEDFPLPQQASDHTVPAGPPAFNANSFLTFIREKRGLMRLPATFSFMTIHGTRIWPTKDEASITEDRFVTCIFARYLHRLSSGFT